MAHLDQPVTAEDVEQVFGALLNRPVNNDAWKKGIVGTGVRVGDFMASVRRSPELRARVFKEAGATMPSPNRIEDQRFRLPGQLAVTPPRPARFLLIGSCLMDTWPSVISAAEPGCRSTGSCSTTPPPCRP